MTSVRLATTTLFPRLTLLVLQNPRHTTRPSPDPSPLKRPGSRTNPVWDVYSACTPPPHLDGCLGSSPSARRLSQALHGSRSVQGPPTALMEGFQQNDTYGYVPPTGPGPAATSLDGIPWPDDALYRPAARLPSSPWSSDQFAGRYHAPIGHQTGTSGFGRTYSSAGDSGLTDTGWTSALGAVATSTPLSSVAASPASHVTSDTSQTMLGSYVSDGIMSEGSTEHRTSAQAMQSNWALTNFDPMNSMRTVSSPLHSRSVGQSVAFTPESGYMGGGLSRGLQWSAFTPDGTQMSTGSRYTCHGGPQASPSPQRVTLGGALLVAEADGLMHGHTAGWTHDGDGRVNAQGPRGSCPPTQDHRGAIPPTLMMPRLHYHCFRMVLQPAKVGHVEGASDAGGSPLDEGAAQDGDARPAPVFARGRAGRGQGRARAVGDIGGPRSDGRIRARGREPLRGRARARATGAAPGGAAVSLVRRLPQAALLTTGPSSTPAESVGQPRSGAPAGGSAATSDQGAADLPVISELEEMAHVLDMGAEALMQWRTGIVFGDSVCEEYYTATLEQARNRVESVAGYQGGAVDQRGEESAAKDGAGAEARLVDMSEESEPEDDLGSDADESTTGKKMAFARDRPDRRDLIMVRYLFQLQPFSRSKIKLKTFAECARSCWEGHRAFAPLAKIKGAHRCLINRYEQLREWLRCAEGWSAMDSGTKEDDTELREKLTWLVKQEAGLDNLARGAKADRDKRKADSILANDLRENLAASAPGLADGSEEGDTDEAKKPSKAPATAMQGAIAAVANQIAEVNRAQLEASAKRDAMLEALAREERQENWLAREESQKQKEMELLIRRKELALKQKGLDMEHEGRRELTEALASTNARLTEVQAGTGEKMEVLAHEQTQTAANVKELCAENAAMRSEMQAGFAGMGETIAQSIMRVLGGTRAPGESERNLGAQ